MYSQHLASAHGVTDDPTAVLIQHLTGLHSTGADEAGADEGLPDEEVKQRFEPNEVDDPHH